jgi:hypothetical protein
MSLLIPLVFVLACDRPATPPQAAPPEKVAIPGTSLAFDAVSLPGTPGKVARSDRKARGHPGRVQRLLQARTGDGR